jgi:hypothetical protein
MNDKQTYTTRKEAQAQARKMVGWVAKPSKIVDFNDNGERADVWVIRCNERNAVLYLRTEGYVR